jgi:hypothetical protein
MIGARATSITRAVDLALTETLGGRLSKKDISPMRLPAAIHRLPADRDGDRDRDLLACGNSVVFTLRARWQVGCRRAKDRRGAKLLSKLLRQ